jgi:glycolate oxidase FAD binding subunit
MKSAVLSPADDAEVSACVADAAARGGTLYVQGGGSKRDFGRPVDAAATLDLSRLSEITDYEPAELYLTAKAATSLAQIESVLQPHRQMLAFEPPDWRGLFGGAGEPTIGGVVSCNLAGPRRVRAGAARDHLLGFAAVNGRGERWKSGGKVVKNVTGYDMCKLQAGAFGTLSVLTEMTLRLLPLPETTCTILATGLTEPEAVRLMSDALNTPHEVSAAAHLPAGVAARALPGEADASRSLTAFRLEGHAPSVAFRREAIAQICPRAVHLDDAESKLLWRAIGDVGSLLPDSDALVWRICTTPSRAAEMVAGVRARFGGVEAYYDWGGGLVWLGIAQGEAGEDGGARLVRAALGEAAGHATLVRAPLALRARADVFQPVAPAMARLAARVKTGFDPLGVLNPKRIHRDF